MFPALSFLYDFAIPIFIVFFFGGGLFFFLAKVWRWLKEEIDSD